jgi:DNA-binding IclR family transcriptional regulator
MTGTFPALLALPRDETVRAFPTAVLVYLHCLNELDFADPRPFKASAVAETLRIKEHTAGRMLTLLTERGFLVLHGRAYNRVRTYTLAWSVAPQGHTSSAA